MKKTSIVLLLLVVSNSIAQSLSLRSPNNQCEVIFNLINGGIPTYTLKNKGEVVIKESRLGIQLVNDKDLVDNFKVTGNQGFPHTETWKPVLGEVDEIQNNYNELLVELEQTTTARKLNLYFRVYDEGLGFRYEFPQQDGLDHFIIQDEITEFNLTGDHKAFWMPGDYDSNEYVYNESKISAIDTESLDYNNGIGAKGKSAKYEVQSPLLLKSDDGMYISIFEAAVMNYPVMHLKVNPKRQMLRSQLVPDAVGNKAYLQTPCKTPWRTIIATKDARELASSKMILNLNEPSKIEDTSWIKPMKYVGIWWEMHVGVGTWNYADKNEKDPKDLKPNRKHSATTKNAIKYIDFAKKHGFDGVLIEGWNVGWEDWAFKWKDEVFDFVTPYRDFKIKQITQYAKEQGIELIMHHETSSSVGNYERRLDRAFDFMKEYGYKSVKTGYVGHIIPRGEYHDGQSMVNHYHHVVKRAADYKFMVNSHESSRPTGVHRTYPNYIAAEAARGNEFNAWSVGNPPSHETILPFTRMLGGPMDYTPGIFEIKMNNYTPGSQNQVHTTLAKQLALYVTMYSPLQMAADLPDNYEKHLDAFQFIKDVSVDWQETAVLEAEPGDFITIARRTKGANTWFLGAITDENPRQTTLSMDFLNDFTTYKAVIYEDADDAHWKDNPKAYKIRTIDNITSKSTIDLKLAAGGGAAISFFPVN